MQFSFDNIVIRGISTALPAQSLSMTSLADKFGEKEVSRIIKSTGIKSVRVAPANMKCSDLSAQAVRVLLDHLKYNTKTIDAIVFVSQTPDYVAPATSAILQHELGLSKNVVAFDINYGCSGYIYGLYQAAMLLKSGCKRVLLCAGDVITSLLDENDRNVRMILGDASSATILEKGNGEMTFNIKTDGSGAPYLTANRSKSLNREDGYYYMNGAKVMEFALREVPAVIDELLKIRDWNKADVGSFLLHQPNKFMLEYLSKKAKLPKEAVPIAVESVGNTGPASIPVTLSLTAKKLKDEKRLSKVVLCGFGVGLSWGACSANLQNTEILDAIDV